MNKVNINIKKKRKKNASQMIYGLITRICKGKGYLLEKACKCPFINTSAMGILVSEKNNCDM